MKDDSGTVQLQHERLGAIMKSELVSRGVTAEGAGHVTAALIEASLRGVDSHGVNLYPHYCRVAESGRINLAPKMSLSVDEPSCAVVDADHAFGHEAGQFGMATAMEKARATGMAIVAVKNSSHFGSAAYYGLTAARAGMIGMAFTNADALVKAHGSSVSFFGTNPICFTMPMAGEEPLCLDMATSCTSWNNIKNHRRSGAALEPGWAFDGSGEPVTDADAARSLAPIGAYKGFGLGLMVEVLCSLLSDSPFGVDVLPMYQSLPEKRYVSHCFMAIDISRLVDRERFEKRMAAMAARIRELPSSDPAAPPMVAGDPEKANMIKRLSTGIPMHETTYEEFIEVSEQFTQARIDPRPA